MNQSPKSWLSHCKVLFCACFWHFLIKDGLLLLKNLAGFKWSKLWLCKNETPLPLTVSLVSWCCCVLCTWHYTIGREAGLRFHTHPCHERLSMWESLKCIHAHNVEEARGHSNGCQGLVCLSELKTTFSVSLAAGMSELYNPAGGHRWECHIWDLIKCNI